MNSSFSALSAISLFLFSSSTWEAALNSLSLSVLVIWSYSAYLSGCFDFKWWSNPEVVKVFAVTPPREMSAEHVLQIAIRASFSDIFKYLQAADMLAVSQPRAWSRAVLVAAFWLRHHNNTLVYQRNPVLWHSAESRKGLFNHFRPIIFGSRIFGASLLNIHWTKI